MSSLAFPLLFLLLMGTRPRNLVVILDQGRLDYEDEGVDDDEERGEVVEGAEF